MDINITSSATQQANCSQLDRLAHDYLGVPASLDDPSAGYRKDDTITLPTPITATDGVYTDTQAAFKEKGITISGTQYQRILDPNVLKVLKAKMEESAISDGKILAEKFKALTSIGTWFASNTNIKSFKELKDSGVTSLSGAFNGCTALEHVILPNTLVTIGTNSFNNCTGLKELVIPSSVRTLSGQAYTLNIISPTIEEGLTTLGNMVFSSCTFKTLVLPSTVTTIGSSILHYSNITTLVVKAVNPPTLAGSPFYPTIKTGSVIYVPDDSVEAYKAASVWSDLAAYIKPLSEYVDE